MSELKKTSAVEKPMSDKGLVQLRTLDDLGMIDLRGNLKAKGFKAAVKKILGCALPEAPRTSTENGQISVLWLSIDQWLIICPDTQTSEIVSKLSAGLKNIHSLVVDMSDARTIIRLEGKGAREVLMKGTPVDLTVNEYQPGSVRRLRFAENAAMVHIRSLAPEVIDLYVFRSYAAYSWAWLEETARPSSRLELFTKQAVAAT